MSIYITIYFIIFLYAFNQKLSKSKLLKGLLIIILCVFLCMGYMTGSDWRGYEYSYDYINPFTDIKGYEYSYSLIQFLFIILGIDFWCFFIILKLICFFITLRFMKRYSNNNYILPMLLFFGVFALDAYIDNPMRNLIASVIYLYSIKYIISKNIYKYIIVVLIASTFHSSALFTLPLYFVNRNIKNKVILISIISIFIVSVLFQVFFRQLLYEYFWLSDNILSTRFGYNYVDETFYEDRNLKNPITFGLIFHLFSFLLLFINRKNINEVNYGRTLFNLTYIYVIVYLLSFSIEIFFRVRLFLFLPYIICLSFLPYIYMKNIKMKLMSFATIIIISFFTMTSTITKSYKYIPYTNYMSYIFQEKPTYLERSMYNFNNSPYAKDN